MRREELDRQAFLQAEQQAIYRSELALLEDLLDMRPEEHAARVLRGRMSQRRADELCQQQYGCSFAEERHRRQAADADSKRKNRFWLGIGASRRRSSRPTDQAGPLTESLRR